MRTTDARISRRRFLLGAAAGGTAAAGALVAGSKPKTSGPGRETNAAAPQSGYQVTEHVRNYYRTARL